MSSARRIEFRGFELDSEATRCEFRIEVNGTCYPFWVRSLTEGVQLHPTANAALPVALLAGMSEGQNVDLGGQAASKVMLAAMEPVQNVYCDWFEHFRPIEFEGWVPWQDGDRLRGEPRGTLCFFSGGVDAFYTLLKHRDEIDALLFVHGLDFAWGHKGLSRDAEARHDVAVKIHEVADALDLGLVEVEVDFESLRELRVPWQSAYGGRQKRTGTVSGG